MKTILTGDEPINTLHVPADADNGYSATTYEGITIRQQFAMAAIVDAEGWEVRTMEHVLGYELNEGNVVDRIKFFADFKAYLKVVEADALINALNKTS